MSKDNMLLGYARGKVGSLVFARRMGQQITRAYNGNPRDAATKAQVEQRVRIANVVAMYRVIRSLANHSFEGAKNGQTSYNLFIKANLSGNNIVLTKEAASLGACVVAPYLVSRGNMPSIIVSGLGAEATTNIAVGSLVINEETTIGQFADAVVANNPGLNYGDQLTYLSIVQATDSNTGYPVATATIYEVSLQQGDTSLLRDYMPEVATTVRNGRLAHGELIANGGFCWILSRRLADGSLSVSTQRIILTSKDVASQYQGAAAITKAVSSYGFNSDPILVPNGPGQSGSSSDGGGLVGSPSISSIKIGDVTPEAGGTSGVSVAQGEINVAIQGSSLSKDSAFVVLLNGASYNVNVNTGSSATKVFGTITTSSQITANAIAVTVDGAQLYTWEVSDLPGYE